MLTPIPLDACNAGPMVGRGNNTYLVAAGGAALLVDAGVGHPDHLIALERALAGTRSALETVAVTHHHADHVSGVAAIACAHARAVFAKYPFPGDRAPHGFAWQPLGDGDVLRCGAVSLTVVHTPGHSPDHAAFWHEPTGTLLSGDLVIAGRTVMIDASRGGDMKQYLRSLERVLELGPRQLLPAHGPRIDDPRSLVHSYLAHRRMRERQIIEAMRGGHRTVEGIAESIYHDLEPGLMAAARDTVRAHLAKLAAEGIAADRDGWRVR